jgi:hypothetical protein
MALKSPVINLLEQLQQVLAALSDQQYTTPVALLSHATIGQHTRHIIEFYAALQEGYDNGVVNYDKRKRDFFIESDRSFAIAMLVEIAHEVDRPDKELSLVVDFNRGAEDRVQVTTNYFRELIYNLEHTIHHMALLRIGIGAISEIRLPGEFGVAASTLKFRLACAQ